MAVFFGTDGIRGVVNDFLTYDLAYKCGNAVGRSANSHSILIGGDTRTTRSFLSSAFAGGAMSAGANVIDIGVCPTAGIAYLTQKLGMNYGVVVSASHNPAEYNGIKIFDEKGFKLGDKNEEILERKFVHEKNVDGSNIGQYVHKSSLVKFYEDHLVSCCKIDLRGLTIVLDAGNGAAYKVASRVFKKLGAKVISTHCKNDGAHINYNCGALFPKSITNAVKRYGADMGFAFDGDADRIIACDESGKLIDGDLIIFMLAKYLKNSGNLSKNTVVGTSHTNIGIEKDLQKEGIRLLRTDIGDKYVIAKIEEERLSLGGEKSGHVILREYTTTGDGILTGIKLAEMAKKMGEKLSELSQANLFPQCNIDCIVSDKLRVINSEKLTKAIEQEREKLGENARLMVRCSGTEPKIRIMVECENENKAKSSAVDIKNIVYEIDKQNER